MAKAKVEANYHVEIESSSREFTAKERIAIKDTSDAVKLDTVCDTDSIVIKPTDWAILSVHNEKSDNVDYKVFILWGEDGTKYVTGSSNFFDSFIDIYNEMADSDEDWSLKVYKLDSKNYAGKKFITCSIV